MNPTRRARVAGVSDNAEVNQAEIIRLLSQRFGDGLIYLADDTDQEILRRAMETGLVSADGHLTTAGYRVLKRSARD